MIDGQLSICTAEQLRWGDYIIQNELYVTAAPWVEDGVAIVPTRNEAGTHFVTRYTDSNQTLTVIRPC